MRAALVFALAALALALPGAGNAAPPSNDDFASATAISSLPFSDDVSLAESVDEPGEPQSCYVPAKTAWYAITAASTQVLRVSIAGSSDPGAFAAIYHDTGGGISGLSFVNCVYSWNGGLSSFTAQAGETYYIRASSYFYFPFGSVHVGVQEILPPANDDFASASAIGGLPYSNDVDTTAATAEPQEPAGSCFGPPGEKTAWYSYTPTQTQSVTARVTYAPWAPVAIVAYSGSSLGSLQALGCGYAAPVTFRAQAGVTYRFQVGSFGQQGGPLTFTLDVAPDPVASINYHYPYDASAFDQIQFVDGSYDPAGAGISAWHWVYGDGSSSDGQSAQHRYAADGDYTVTLTVTTADGRSASTQRLVQVRTHDVAITKLVVPQSAAAGQSRELSVALKNIRYAESVTVTFFRSHVGGGWDQVGTQTQTVPVRSGNKTTAFSVLYTFTADDKAVGKVTFRAVATINGPRDALPADNEVIALPTKVN